MNQKNAKKILKIIALIYVASFLVINWNDISWVFNYREVSGLVSDFFNPYPSIDASAINAYFPSVKDVVGSQNNLAPVVKSVKTVYTEKQNILEIPKISISVPIVFSNSVEKKALEKDLDSGVVYYPGSVLPGELGQIVILGHSAPLGWPKIKHDWVFSDIDKLLVGDIIYIDYKNAQYKYIVKSKQIIQKGAEIPQSGSGNDINALTLISCWPPGKDYQRITVSAELVPN